MTKTALENKKIKQAAEIADKDRQLKEKELSHKKEQFKHQKKMDKINTIFGVSKQTGDAALKLATIAANDPEWYKRYFTDLSLFSNVATYYRAGTNVLDKLVNTRATYDATPGSRSEFVNSYESPSGIAVCEWIPTIGAGPEHGSDLSLSPVNQILMRTKEQVLKSNSRSNTDWEAGDLGFNIVATASILLAISEFERAVYAVQTYYADNAYMPEGLLMALGCNATNWTRDIVDARKYLLLLKKRFNEAIVAPSYASIYARYQYLGSSFISDSETKPQQIYVFRAAGYYQLVDEPNEHLAYINPTRTTPYLWYTQISSMIQNITEHPDYINMYSDLRSAFSDNLISLDLSFDENAGLAPTYKADSIEQISSIKTLPVYWYGDASDEYETCNPKDASIRQSTAGYLYQGENEQDPYLEFTLDLSGGAGLAIPGPSLAVVKNVNSLSQLHNLHKDNVTGDDILDITRWNIVLDADRTTYNDDGAVLHVLSSDIAIAICWRFIKFAKSGTRFVLNADDVLGSTNLYNTDTRERVQMLTSSAYNFNWMPCIRNIYIASAAGVAASTVTTTLCEFQHPFIIGLDTLSQLNAACVLSEFFINSDQFKH